MNKVFTREELQQFNGLQKQPAYVAFDGQVYDVSSIFKQGEHYKIKAGTDITDVFVQSPHSLDILSKVPVVGRLKTESTFLQKVFSVSQSNSLLILRLALGIIFFAHGSQKLLGWFGGYGWAGTIGFFSQTLNIPVSLAGIVIIIEFFGGVAIILGLLTRPAALGLAIVSLVAIIKVHWANGFFLEGSNHGIEFVFVLFMLALFLLIKGSGSFSIDKVISENLQKTIGSNK